jgi:hypothetical protein
MHWEIWFLGSIVIVIGKVMLMTRETALKSAYSKSKIISLLIDDVLSIIVLHFGISIDNALKELGRTADSFNDVLTDILKKMKAQK